tara:strand:- start:3919 stop:5838 length:1920 start_codon:yes stop_codon:yes gene_type:complete
MSKGELISGALTHLTDLFGSFFSPAQKGADKLVQRRGRAEQMKEQLIKGGGSGTKSELEWIGFDDWLKDNPNPTKSQIQNFINENKFKLTEQFRTYDPAEQMLGKEGRVRDLTTPSIKRAELYKDFIINASRDKYLWDKIFNSPGVDPINRREFDSFTSDADRLDYIKRTETDISNRTGERTSHIIDDSIRYPGYNVPSPVFPLFGHPEYGKIAGHLLGPQTRLDPGHFVPGRVSPAQLVENYRQQVIDATPRYAHWESHSLPGGTNKREITWSIPHSYAGKFMDPSSHFDSIKEGESLFGWVRLADHVTADGKRVLLIDEMQSPWLQLGQKHGFAMDPAKRLREIEDEIPKATEILEKNHNKARQEIYNKNIYDYSYDYSQLHKPLEFEVGFGSDNFEAHVASKFQELLLETYSSLDLDSTNKALRKVLDELTAIDENFPRKSFRDLFDFARNMDVFREARKANTKINNLYREEREVSSLSRDELYEPSRQSQLLPDAPMKNTWHKVMFNRVLGLAAEGNYDMVAWTPSGIQIDRANPETAKGMIRFYDQALPNAARQSLRKFDKKATVTNIDLKIPESQQKQWQIESDTQPVRGMEISPAAKGKIFKQGYPSFASGVPIAAGSAGALGSLVGEDIGL